MPAFSLAPRKNEMLDTLCKLLRIKSVKSEGQTLMPYGKGIFDVLMKTLEIADHLDLDGVNLYSRMGYVDFGEGSETIAILTHLDVVPAGDGWTVPPFEGTIRDGRVYGRGAIDNKGPAVAALYALSALKENDIFPTKKIRLLFGCDEESGWSDIAYYKEKVGEIPDYGFSPDAEFPIVNAEKGLLQLAVVLEAHDETVEHPKSAPVLLSFQAGERVNVVPARAECVLEGQSDAIPKLVELFNKDRRVPVQLECKPGVDKGTVRIIAHGTSAHGSKPENGVNAAVWLIFFLTNAMPLAVNPQSALIRALAERVGNEIDGKSMRIACVDRTGTLTVNLGYVHADGEKVEAGLDIRYPVTLTESFVFDKVREAFSQCYVEKRFALPPHYVDPDSFLVERLKEAYHEITDLKPFCRSIGGATYARAFPNCVGFGPVFPGHEGTEHQPDEYIEIDTFIKLADIIAASVIELCR